MALWGNNDSVYSSGTISAINAPNSSDQVLITGSQTQWESTSAVDVGQVVTIPGYGSGLIVGPERSDGIGANTAMLLYPHNFTNTGNVTGLTASYNISEAPKYTVEDSNWGADEIYGVDNAEMEETVDDASQYHPAHAGWVGITTYNDTHGNLRVKTEVLVAMGADSGSNGGITGDASDDTILPDS